MTSEQVHPSQGLYNLQKREYGDMCCADNEKENKRWVMALLNTAQLLATGGHEGMAGGDARS